MICVLPVTVEPFQFSPAEPVAYELSYTHLEFVICEFRIFEIWSNR
jgi:hypothetical protein